MIVFVKPCDSFQFEKFQALNAHPDFKFVLLEHEYLSDNLDLLKEWGRGSAFLIVESSVIFPNFFFESVSESISRLNETYPKWGIAGPAGLGVFEVGFSASNFINFCSSPTRLPNLAHFTIPAIKLTPALTLVNSRNLSYSSVIDPKTNNINNFFLEFSFSQGKQAILDWGLSAFVSDEALNALARFKSLHVPDSLTFGGLRPAVRLAVVTRTIFNRPEMLARCINSVKEFAAKANSIYVQHLVFASCKIPEGYASANSTSVTVIETDIDDSRFFLLQESIKVLDADYVLILDDDDFLVSNHASQIGNALNFIQRDSILHFDSELHFEKGPLINGMEIGAPYRTIRSNSALTAFEGLNQSPFSSIMWPLSVLKEIPASAFLTLALLEDFYILLTSWSSKNLPVFLPFTLSGISIRDSGTSLSMKDRAAWNKARATVGNQLAKNAKWNLNSTPRRVLRTPAQKFNKLLGLLNFSLLVHFFRLGMHKRLLRGSLSFPELTLKIKTYLRNR